MTDYWIECIQEAFDEHGIVATSEQVKNVAAWVDGANENHEMTFGHDCKPNPLAVENDRLKLELDQEINKVHCDECNGRGRIITVGYIRNSSSECTRCRGEGRHAL